MASSRISVQTAACREAAIILFTDSDYSVKVDCTPRRLWYKYLSLFHDASIFQTWSYGSVSWNERNISHLVLRKGGTIAGICQVRIIKPPGMQTGIAYVRWGPVWRHASDGDDFDALRYMLRALREEYVFKRNLILRVIPHISHSRHQIVPLIYHEEGYRLQEYLEPYRTFIVDLAPRIEEIRRGITHRARNHLVRAEKRDFYLIHGTEDALFDDFLKIYGQTVSRKRFINFISANTFRTIQHDLPEAFKMRIMVCYLEGEPCSALVCSPIGETGLTILSANSNASIESNNGSSYIVFWNMCTWLKENGYSLWDLGGIDPSASPGTYRFKKNFTGNNGATACSMGAYDCWANHAAYLSVRCLDYVRSAFRRALIRILKRRRAQIPENSKRDAGLSCVKPAQGG